MTQSSTPTRLQPAINPKDAVLNRLLAGPTYPEVAAILLRDGLKKLYPTLNLDPHTTVVGEPHWDIVDGEIVERQTRYETLSDMLAGLLNESGPTLLIEGFHFLTQLPLTTPDVHLPVRIDQIGRLINELQPAMLTACQEQQLAYWNASVGDAGPRWHELSSALRTAWDVKRVKGWSEAECAMARHLFRYPDRQGRQDNNLYDAHAYLIDIDGIDGDQVQRMDDNTIVVLIGKIDNKEVILKYSIVSGYERFETQQALGQSLPAHLAPDSYRKIQWRLYEPDGNIFDYKACGMIAEQVKIIGTSNASDTLTFRETAESPSVDATDDIVEVWFQKQMPHWLQAASPSDQVLFAQHMKNLSILSHAHAGKTYLEDIPAIKTFALNALETQMTADHADAAKLDLETIEIEVRSPVIWGSFVVPGRVDTARFSLVELALQNLIALPLGNKTVRSLDDSELPEWMTVAYLENLITQIDIGRVYPELVKSKLLDDPTESASREKLYTAQLRIQLPMLALESKIRGQGNLDEKGYRYVAALMEPEEADRKVDGNPIVLRQLAFVPELQLGNSEDVVTNMFVIGPQDSNAGPCLLYRPMLEPQLCQYPSFSNLLYAIRQTPALRQSVLAWLPDGVRDDYGRYVFPDLLPSPWSIVAFVAAPLTSLANSGPIGLTDKTLGTDFLPLLFKANAEALVELADRESISNHESRWQTFKRAGWLMLNLALPYLGTAVGTATWLWQILDEMEQLTQNREGADSQAKWETFTDLLLNIALAIITHTIDRARAARRPRRPEAPEVVAHELENLPKPKPEFVIEQRAPLASTALPTEHYATIRSSGALVGRSRESAKLLDSFSLDAPQDPGQRQTEGAFKGLYEQAGDWYANLSGKWFKVLVEGEQVSIIDEKDPARVGPPLMGDAKGEWHVDTRLRLRGSGSQGVRQKVIAAATRRRIELLQELNLFEAKKPQHQKLLTMQAQEMNEATGAAKETKRYTYINTLKAQRENYEQALKILLEWPVFQSRPDYPRTRLGYLNAQVNFTFVEMDALNERFTPVMSKAKAMITSGVKVLEQAHIDTAENMIRVGDDMIERLDYMETRFAELKEVGHEGFEFVRRHRRKMPLYTSDDLQLIKIDMFRHLCLSLESVESMPEGWEAINQIVDNATVAFQSLRDAIDERSVIRLDEQIDAFGSLIEQFTAIDEHLQYLANEYKGSARPIQLTRLRTGIGLAKKRTLRHLAAALDERSNRRIASSPYDLRPRPRKKFIRARFWGLVSGEPRLSKTLEETDWVDVKNPFSGEIIVTFHRKETGEWIPHVKPDATPAAVPALATSINKGTDLINGLTAFKAQIEETVEQTHQTPAGIGMILNAHAGRMEKVSAAIQKALDQAQGVESNETAELPAVQRRSAEALRLQLEKEANTLYVLGFETVLNVIKRRPPTMSSVIWLKSRNQISITKQKTRQQIKTPPYGYLDRYEIKDLKTNKTLWFADFRYSTNWVPAYAFLSGRLKTLEQIDQKISPVIPTKAFNQRQLIDHYRSEIAADQAKGVFFQKKHG
ncbi:dermonecrotic toxin domain-containing protein [Pseudomonas sp.]|uniref:dermonecrotic toxin domain-containing protein n=1 Tax=Pseudomonas sp. TaxID=306 RepID=UPI003A984B69